MAGLGFSVFPLVVVVLLWGVVAVSVHAFNDVFYVLLLLLMFPATLFSFIMYIGLSVRRCHDFGKSGWLSLWSYVPYIGLIFCIYSIFKKGDTEANVYGSVPNLRRTIFNDLFNQESRSGHMRSYTSRHMFLVVLLAIAIPLLGVFATALGIALSIGSTDQVPQIHTRDVAVASELVHGREEMLALLSSTATSSRVSQTTRSSFVVNILCRDMSSLSGGFGGSGTLLTKDGLVLTNAHVIPQDGNGNPKGTCVVVLPDAQGKVKAIYSGQPVLAPGWSHDYDLAFIKINGPYTNELGLTQGEYPTSFPNIRDLGCVNNTPKLGDKVQVLGYPFISAGGTYLTVTSGEVSSFPDDGTLVTSAKVDHGNSGGLAVDERGCMLGVPSAISNDGSESLGVIYSNAWLLGFANGLPAQDSLTPQN